MKSKLSGIRQALPRAISNLKATFAHDQHHGAIMRGFFVVAVFGMLAKLAGAGKEIVVAARYGVSPVVDAYLFVFNLLNAPVSIWYGAIFAILVPQFIRMKKDEPEAAIAFRREFAGSMLIAGTLIGLLFLGGLYVFLVSGASGLAPSTMTLAKRGLFLMWPIVPVMFAVHYGSTRLIAANQHMNSLYEGLPALAIMIAVLAMPTGSLYTLALATLIGTLVQLAFTVGSMGRIDTLHPPTLSWSSSAWPIVLPALLTMLAAQGLQSTSSIVDQLIAARLSPGSLAVLGYSMRVLSLLLTLVALAVPRILLPAFSRLLNEAPERLPKVADKWAALLFFGGLVSAAVASHFARPIVEILFERGAFSSTNTTQVANMVSILAWQLPFFITSLVYTQLNFSNGTYRSIVIAGFMSILIKIFAGLPLIYYFGLHGLAYSTNLIYLFQTIYLYFNKRGQSGAVARNIL